VKKRPVKTRQYSKESLVVQIEEAEAEIHPCCAGKGVVGMPDYEAYTNCISAMVAELKALANEHSSIEFKQKMDVVSRLCTLSRICLDCTDSLLSSEIEQRRHALEINTTTTTDSHQPSHQVKEIEDEPLLKHSHATYDSGTQQTEDTEAFKEKDREKRKEKDAQGQETTQKNEAHKDDPGIEVDGKKVKVDSNDKSAHIQDENLRVLLQCINMLSAARGSHNAILKRIAKEGLETD